MPTDDPHATPTVAEGRGGGKQPPVAQGFVETPAGDPDRGEALVMALGRSEAVAGRDYSRAAIGGRNLAGADLSGVVLSQADFTGAFLVGASFRGADLRRAVFRFAEIKGADFDNARMWGLEMDEFTFKNSGWSAERFAALHKQHRFQIVGLDSFPIEVRRLLQEQHEGLTIFLSTRLLPWDQTMLHAFACSVLGMDTDVRVADYTERGEGCRVRLVGSDPDDLVEVAEHLAQVTWRTEQKNALQAAGLLGVDGFQASMDHIRKNVDKMEVWVREKQDEHAVAQAREVALRRAWTADVLKAAWDHLIQATRVKGLIEVGARTVSRAVEVVSGARDERDRQNWEAEIARQELEEEVPNADGD